MSSDEQDRYIGFPPPLLGEKPQRLRVLGAEPGQWLALEKPAMSLIEPHRWHPHVPALVPGLKAQADAGKPELEPYGITELKSVYTLDPWTTGAAVMALSAAAAKAMRDAYGSGQWQFRFQFLAKASRGDLERICELPIAVHRTQARALISHETGKKCRTVFRQLEQLGDYAWWEAESTYLRMHQIRLHACEVGLPIVGDRLYRGPKPIMLSNLKRGYRKRGEETPLYEGLCLHLSELQARLGEGELRVASRLPKGFAVLSKRLRQHQTV